METIRVNMTPCEDVQTIHASQDDNEAREWGFELHNNGELIDTSEITEQMFFKAYKGGTEEILPTNGSVPTTSPFKGDIRYPQGLLTDQEFTYRQSPTEEDGLAKITDIKGNTLVWNQLIKNGNFADGLTNWIESYATLSVSNGVCRATFTGSAWNNDIRQNATIVNGHKYLLSFDYLTSADIGDLAFTSFGDITVFMFRFSSSTTKKHYSAIQTAMNSLTGLVRFTMASNMSSMSGQYYEVSNVNLFDLTQMFGAGNEPATVEEFASLFPLSYYDYNQGSLLSFNGNGIKTVGFNQWDEEWEVGGINSSSGHPATGNDRFRSKNFISLLPNVVYYAKIEGLTSNDFRMYYYDANKNFIGVGDWQYSGTFTTPNNAWFGKFVRVNKNTFTRGDICINISDPNRNGTYEPYTSSTLSLPISTYFPNGMKSAGSVYDELTESKAITRVGSRAYQSGDESDTSVITDGTTTYYALVTPTETSFTTASLVTENAEIPLSNEDGVLIGKCTEQLSENPGFIDAKIKLSDGDGNCYSNKLQLHVERSPQ